MRTWNFLAAAGLAPCLTACAGAAPTRDLGLKHIVLYQNGVAYFERSGVLAGDRMRLRFKEHDVDDVLKTLVVVEQGGRAAGGKRSTVTALLPQKKTGEGEDSTWIDVVLSPHPSRDISIAYAVPSAAWKSAYRVVLPDTRGGKTALFQAWALVDNVTDEDWSDVALTLATGAPLTFTTHLRDPRFVQRPDAPAGPDATAHGPVYASRGTPGDRDGDGIPDVDDRCPDEPGPNDTDGCPEPARRVIVSSAEIQILQNVLFARDSDEMLATSRPIVDAVASTLKAHPDIGRVVIEGFAGHDEKDAWALAARRAGAVRAALLALGVKNELAARGFGDTRPIASNDTADGRSKNRRVGFHVEPLKNNAADGRVTVDAAGAARGVATGREAAGAFRYDLANHVSIPRKSSTMVTIVNDDVPGEDILLYRPDPAVPGSDAAPFRAARLKNQTSAGFLSGPVAIFAGGTFVGEGLIDRLNPGDTALIPYGLDATTTVKVESVMDETPLRVIGLVKGTLTVEDRLRQTTRYIASIGSAAPARLFVRHAPRPGFKLEGAPPESESSPGDAMLVPVPVTPGQRSVLALEESVVNRHEVSLLTIEASRLSAYLKGSDLPAPIATRLADVVALRAELSKRDVEMDGLRERLGELAQRAGELRESLRAVERTPRAAVLQKELVDRLTDATKRTDELSGQLAAATASRAEARSKLVDTVRDLHLEQSASPGT